MLGFGMGTVPALLIVGKLAGLNWLKSRKIIYEIGAVLMIVVGIYFVIKGLRY
jgi:sulfite exporter TauE/SafE